MDPKKAIDLINLLKIQLNKYYSNYVQLIDNFLGDKQRKKPIGEFLQDLRAGKVVAKSEELKNEEPDIRHPAP